MARGFIRNPLDVRLLILYILDRLILPVTMAELTEPRPVRRGHGLLPVCRRPGSTDRKRPRESGRGTACSAITDQGPLQLRHLRQRTALLCPHQV